MELLKSLLNLTCVSGFEKEGNAELKNLIKNICGNCGEDAMGNLFGFIRSENDNAPTVMLTAHYDIIGLMVRDIRQRQRLLRHYRFKASAYFNRRGI